MLKVGSFVLACERVVRVCSPYSKLSRGDGGGGGDLIIFAENPEGRRVCRLFGKMENLGRWGGGGGGP